MAQLTLYLPDEVATRLRREARREKKSLSAYVVDQLAGRGDASASARDKRLRALFGSCQLPDAIEDTPPDEIEGL